MPTTKRLQAALEQAPTDGSTLALEMLLHDLSAPVRHIGFFTDQLADSIPSPTPEQKGWLLRIRENLETERALLMDSRLLLSVERHPAVERGDPVRVNALLEEVAASFDPEFRLHGVELLREFADDAPVIVDPKALCRVVSNLLGNALKATPRGGVIRLTSRLEGAFMMFRVSDTGDGFTRKQAAGISRGWDAFDRGVNPPEIWGGLGLLICHTIVLRYGGQLSLVSGGAQKGATFSFGIPAAPAEPGTRAP